MKLKKLIKLESEAARARELYRPQPVALHQCPPWAKERFRIVAGYRSFTNVEAALGGPRIFDHWGQSPSGSLVGEPYIPFNNPTLRAKVEQIAKGLGVSYSIGSPWSSWWFPGKTVRVEFFETADSIPLDELQRMADTAQLQNYCLLGCKCSALGPSN